MCDLAVGPPSHDRKWLSLRRSLLRTMADCNGGRVSADYTGDTIHVTTNWNKQQHWIISGRCRSQWWRAPEFITYTDATSQQMRAEQTVPVRIRLLLLLLLLQASTLGLTLALSHWQHPRSLCSKNSDGIESSTSNAVMVENIYPRPCSHCRNMKVGGLGICDRICGNYVSVLTGGITTNPRNLSAELPYCF